MITSNDLRKGTVIKVDDDICSVVEFQHVKQARGGAIVRTRLKSLTKGSIFDKTYRGGEKVQDVRLEKRKMQYSYDDGDALVFIDTETYDQESIAKEYVDDILNYIIEGDEVEIAIYEGRPISIEPPIFVSRRVVYAEPAVRGDTATNVMKSVRVETGATISCPLFVEEGDIIKIDTRTGEYVERVKQ